MLRSVRLLLVGLCGLVAACDSTEPEVTTFPAFVGAWTYFTAGSDTYATLSQSQMALDPFSLALGEVRIDGVYPSSLRYVKDRSVYRDFGQTTVTYTLASAPHPVPGTRFVTLSGSPRWASLGVYTRPGLETIYFQPPFPLVVPPVSQSGDTLQVGSSVYVGVPGTADALTVQGMLVIPRRRIEAGVETHMSQAASVIAGDSFTRLINPDGTFTDQRPGRGTLAGGTWSAGPDSTVTFDFGAGETDTRRYRVSGNTLRLAQIESFECDEACIPGIEDAADVAPGTVRSARIVYVSTFARGRL